MLNAKGDTTAFCACALKVPQSFKRFENTLLRIHVKVLYIESGHPRIDINEYTLYILHKQVLI